MMSKNVSVCRAIIENKKPTYPRTLASFSIHWIRFIECLFSTRSWARPSTALVLLQIQAEFPGELSLVWHQMEITGKWILHIVTLLSLSPSIYLSSAVHGWALWKVIIWMQNNYPKTVSQSGLDTEIYLPSPSVKNIYLPWPLDYWSLQNIFFGLWHCAQCWAEP